MHRHKIPTNEHPHKEPDNNARPENADLFDPWTDPLADTWTQDDTTRDGEDCRDKPVLQGRTEDPAEDPKALYKAEVEEMRLRSAAEMENFKKRLSREHQEQLRYATETVLSDLLPTLDNLDLALQYGSQNEACRDMFQGVAMTHKLLLAAVTKHGLTPLGVEAEEFTPETHEAVGFEDRPDLPAGVVSRVLQHGYKLGDRLLRPAKVMINQ
ncbi:MAG: nucleotide exchange factor GrpE [Desulfovibrio sp.]|jgi:molecular chaperone GrpE|nr:nucleotide exchange factor GrpE [Desulfovibrio sp.]